jgi:hypothetical protein
MKLPLKPDKWSLPWSRTDSKMKLPLNPSGRPYGWTPWKLWGCRLHTIPLLTVWHYGFLPGWGWWEVGGEVFFLSCIWCGEWTFHASFIWARGGGFIFLSANGKAQGALLLFLLSLGGGKDFFSIWRLGPFLPTKNARMCRKNKFQVETMKTNFPKKYIERFLEM